MTATVASHRKPRQHPLAALTGGARSARTARTAATLALAGAATATGFAPAAEGAPVAAVADGAGQAAHRLTPDRVKDRVNALYQEAEVATQSYNGAKEAAGAARQELSRLQDEAARRTAELNAARGELGTVAASQYRSGGVDPTVRLLLSADPQRYLDGAAVLERAGSHQATAVAGYARRLGSVRQIQRRAEDTAQRLADTEAALKKHRVRVVHKLGAAEQLLNQLTAEQRQRMAGRGGAHGSAGQGRAGHGTGRGGGLPGKLPAGPGAAAAAAQAPDPRAARAVAYAYAALGKPYVWGATGPSGFDCSGLTQAAWKSGGVSLPRTTYTQISSGPRIDRSQLAPGDLVFFYSGISHVGLYIGDGKMIHAPHPGAPVRIAPIDQMPFAAATRPA
ncbi:MULTISPECIES: NlpC/P60 family protein [unclassified Streptomyces]|uniref:C40 family peptidase n=1 Tax=unclassified Streptomyces TaxID=2593676 RepID=UPI0008926FB0|nr:MULTISPECIES: C40 family peptidase [unclassified Streptomyces]PBC84489.1 NlpC/P60 family protein [Streptomyces sp. 2321.6]SDR30077.1 NlpC/P60 family protein [Streptomyces sp. KS_16]SED33228.1 NlpC/P60 family protein [Streptomyces sp. 2133.1]SNC70572.1 NlpC/P60 family protein [Streptomyces sp. 2114.4]